MEITYPDTCRHFPQCGGCSFLHRPYRDETREKENFVRSLLEPLGCSVGRIVASPVSDGWRHKVQLPLGVRWEGRNPVPTLGCYARASHEVQGLGRAPRKERGRGK